MRYALRSCFKIGYFYIRIDLAGKEIIPGPAEVKNFL